MKEPLGMNDKHLNESALISYEVLTTGASGIVGTLTRYFSKHPKLEADPEWQKREQDGLDLQREVDGAYEFFANAEDPVAAMQPFFDRIAALRIEGEIY